MERSLLFYKAEKGQCPVTEFLDSLPSKVAQKVTWVLKLLQELDPDTWVHEEDPYDTP
jgi:hypothetical protein